MNRTATNLNIKPKAQIKWKPIHEKGILTHQIRNIVPSIIIIILIDIIYRIKYNLFIKYHKLLLAHIL